eukprot:4360631-Amphidinium_carterae.2
MSWQGSTYLIQVVLLAFVVRKERWYGSPSFCSTSPCKAWQAKERGEGLPKGLRERQAKTAKGRKRLVSQPTA